MSSLDQDLVNTLTPEEQEALSDSEMTPDEVDALKAVAGDDTDDGVDDDSDDGDSQDAPPVEGKPEALEAGDAIEAQQDDEPALDAKPAAQAPRYEATLPEDYQAQIDGLKQREAELKARFKAGELDLDEYETERDALIAKREDLSVARVKAEISAEMSQQTARQTWENTVNAYLTAVAKEIDYRKDADKAQDLDQFVKVLAAKPEHSSKPMDWFLAEAHKRVKALYGVADQPVAQQPAKKADTSRKPPLDAVPKNLSQVPGSDGPGDVSDEFGDLDSLDGEDFEQAVARMSAAQRAKFAAVGGRR